jgi:hypothetical protein
MLVPDERDGENELATWFENSMELAYELIGVKNMFQNLIA